MGLRIFLFCSAGILLCRFVTPIWADELNQQSNINNEYKPYGQRYDALDWNLLKAMEAPDFGNVLISPLSLKMVLAMVYEGAAGDTEKELAYILESKSKEELKYKYKEIISSLSTTSNDHVLDLGSRIYVDKSVTPEQRYRGLVQMFYKTEIEALDFANGPATRNHINYWVGNVTHGHIKDLVSESDLHDATLLLANAIYYKGLWRTPFPRNNTHLGVFYTAPQNPVTVSYMFNYGQYYFSESIELDAKILRLPFKDDHMTMFVLLPNSNGGLSKLIHDINPDVLRRHIWLMDVRDVHVYFPKFAFDFNSKLGRILQTLGVQNVFQNTASLPGIARGKGVTKRLMVSNILQKAGIEVNEEGSTAYAATEISLTNKFGTRDAIFNASNPFIFYIEDEFTGTVLFVGKVENPSQVEQLPFRAELAAPSRFKPAANTTTSATQPDYGNTNTSNVQPGMTLVVPSPGIR